MSDYLTNIVARTLGLAAVVQPRLSSLFEPLPVSPGNASIPSFESEATGQYESSSTSTSEVLGRTLVSRADEVQPGVTGHSESREIDRAVSSVAEA
ncbi:MAG TPA: hypothetical protein VEW46_18140, partial [Pyrinomonadaceae bacterium]|nr:hypothetical protein [Pyrinomonadaceae bacterium]